MSEVENELHNGSTDDSSPSDRGGFVALAVLAAALGAGAAVLLAPDQGSKTRKRIAFVPQESLLFAASAKRAASVSRKNSSRKKADAAPLMKSA